MGAPVGIWREVLGPKTQEWFRRYQACSTKTTVSENPDLVFIAAEGSILYDPDGNSYLDCGSPGTNFAGYGMLLEKEFLPEVQRVFYSGLVRFATGDWPTVETVLVKEKIQASVPLSGKGLVFGARSGGSAVEAGIKALRKARIFSPYFLTFHGSFHGRPHGALSLLDPHKKERVERYNLPYQAMRVRFPYLGHPDPELLMENEFRSIGRQVGLRNISAMFLELVQGEGGIRVIDPRGLKAIEILCREHNIAIAIDEIHTGMGRTGSRWCYEQYSLKPELVTLGKALAGNVEDGNALVVREDLSFQKSGQESSTFDLPPLEAACVVRALEVLEKCDLARKAQRSGLILDELLHKKLAGRPGVKDIRGQGLMRGVEFTSGILRDQVIKEAKHRGLLLLAAGFPETEDMSILSGPVVRIMPPLTIGEEELEIAAYIFCLAYEAAAK